MGRTVRSTCPSLSPEAGCTGTVSGWGRQCQECLQATKEQGLTQPPGGPTGEAQAEPHLPDLGGGGLHSAGAPGAARRWVGEPGLSLHLPLLPSGDRTCGAGGGLAAPSHTGRTRRRRAHCTPTLGNVQCAHTSQEVAPAAPALPVSPLNRDPRQQEPGTAPDMLARCGNRLTDVGAPPCMVDGHTCLSSQLWMPGCPQAVALF